MCNFFPTNQTTTNRGISGGAKVDPPTAMARKTYDEQELVLSREPPLSLIVFRHQVQGVECRSFVTSGLMKFSHREIVFTFKLTDKQIKQSKITEEFEVNKDVPNGLVDLVHIIVVYASQGKLATGGRMTRLHPTNGQGLFGNNFRGILYYPCQGERFPAGGLQAFALTHAEIEIVDRVGPVRFMSSLGQAHRQFPTVPWIDTERSAMLGTKKWLESSLIRELGLSSSIASTFICLQTQLPGAPVVSSNTTNGCHDYTWDRSNSSQRAVLIYSKDLCSYLEENRMESPRKTSFGLFSFPTRDVSHILTYPITSADRSNNNIDAIMGGNYRDTGVTSMLGNFFLFTESNNTPQGAVKVEDGFCIFVPSVERIIDAIINKENVKIEASDEAMPLHLVYLKDNQ